MLSAPTSDPAAPADWPSPGRPGLAARSRLVGAVSAQAVQALGGLVLSVAAARLLGASGLAVFSLVYGAIVLAAAVASGLVGDSWTVLDRADARIRAALYWWTAIVVAASVVIALLAAPVFTDVRGPALVLLGLATGAFLVQELVRRALMSVRRYWLLVLTDGVGLAVTIAVLILGSRADEADLALILGALAGGQLASVGAGVLCLRGEGTFGARWPHPAMGEVWSFGSWRAAGQAVKPTVLTVMRTLVLVSVGAAAYGPLEAARVFTAPLLVLITGVGSFLLPQYVAAQDRPPAENLRLADRAVRRLTLGAALLGAMAVLLTPVAGPLVTGSTFEVPLLAVAGWSAYAVSSATVLPYAGLAAVHRQQRRVLYLRSLELVSLLAVVLLLLLAPGLPSLVPFALALGPLLTAVAVRRGLVRAVSLPGA